MSHNSNPTTGSYSEFLVHYIRGEASGLTDPRAARLDRMSQTVLFNLIVFPGMLAVLGQRDPEAAKALMGFLASARVVLPLFPTIGAVIFPNLIERGLEYPGRRYTGNLQGFPVPHIPVPVVGALPRQHVIIGAAFLWLMQTIHGVLVQMQNDSNFVKFLNGFFSDPTAVLILQPILLVLVGILASGVINVGKTVYYGNSQWNVDQFAPGYKPGAGSRPRSFVDVPNDASGERTHLLAAANEVPAPGAAC